MTDLPPVIVADPKPASVGAGANGSRASSAKRPSGAARRKPAAPKSATTAAPVPKVGGKTLRDKIFTQICSLGAVAMIVSPADGVYVMAGAERLADALNDVCNEYPAVRKAFETAAEVGAIGKLVVAVAVIGLPIAANHGALPPMVGDIVHVLFKPKAEGEEAADLGALFAMLGRIDVEPAADAG